MTAISPVRLDGSTESGIEVGLGAIGRHRELAGEREAVRPEPVEDLELDVVPGDGEGAGRGGRRHGQDVLHLFGALEGDLERDHAAKRSAGDQRESLDAERGPRAPTGRRPRRAR